MTEHYTVRIIGIQVYIFCENRIIWFSGYEKENTMKAFQTAVEVAVQRTETDVELSSDGGPVLIYDETLDRTKEASGYVVNHSVKDLQKQGIFLLEELLKRTGSSLLDLNLELTNRSCYAVPN